MNNNILNILKNKFIVFILFFIPILSFAVSDIKITNVRIFNTEKTTRIIFNFSAFNNHAHVFTLANPDRLVFDFNNTQLGLHLNQLSFPSNIKSVREGYPHLGLLRIVMDINAPFTFKRIPQFNPYQMVVDVSIKSLTKSVLPVTKITLTPIRPFVVVIDAGHGGKDTGAIGFYKTREKDIVLSIAMQLAAMINQQPNMRAVLTRKGDYFVPLANRLVLTRKDAADIFIAIHADSYFNSRASGASVFALSPRGATTVAAKWLSDSDNHSELGGVELNRLNDRSPILRSVLIDLAQTVTIRDSLRLGNSILDSLDEITKLHASHVEQAPFMVLKSPDIPSVLVETGFVSNGIEELHLRNREYQHKLVLALFNGIQNYQKKYFSQQESVK